MPPPTQLLVPLTEVLRQLRSDKQLSQEQMAHRAGLDFSYYGQIERAETVPTLGSLEGIAGALGIKLSELIAMAEKLLSAK